jgi:glycosyltransferase involved in cell wall biosynthesis
MRLVSVIVPARDAAPTLPALLDALSVLDVPNGTSVEVLLADDGSSDTTREIATHHPLGVRVVTSPGRGPAAARNAAAAHADGDVLAFTDADCAPRPAWLREALGALDRGAGLVQGAVGPPEGVVVGPFDRTVRVDALSGLYETANLVVRRDLFDRLGGFESWLGTATSKELGEDAWFGWRAVRSGARIAFAPDARVDHAVFAGTPLTFVGERTRLRFFPALMDRIPELRDQFCPDPLFLSSRTRAFDAALAGATAAVFIRRPAPLLATLPYARLLWRTARPWGFQAPKVAATHLAADAIGAAALATGSIRARRLLL